MSRLPRPHPVTLTDRWPDAAIDDVPGEAARLLALGLREQMGDRSARAVGRLCGVDSTTVSAILNGTTWPDLRTIALLEAGLGVPLWPDHIGTNSAEAD
ncbi:helix-turn-helix transcriptional regulator [Demequina sp. SYSU T00039]|uniref:Helix-turn-helix transcriptional regulator n=1 Tax=Demequina lignilytica TaxID=3051663 RepID=A0AAW7M410_9MICO|nr:MULTISPECIES: helix-turn-helix transcriptional regulator [unclassified Demequina]MDN4478631.1 helix-turn-helix transcriptional regulator [Demequina sp. SYSU T00039-1]MDN4488609.1 helix-turn-helix transcriptional regulator [Demequina sp. SYSU T00039]